MRKISDILRTEREARNISLQEIEKETKIKKEFLKAIERGAFNELPSDTYAAGFVKNYAKFLGIPETDAMALFRREYDTKRNITIVPEFRKSQHKFNRRFFLNGRGLVIFFAFLILGVYVFFQYSSLIFPPPLKVTEPSNGAVIKGSVVEVKGETDPYATVTVGGEEAYINIQGDFSKSVYIFTGDSNIEVIAKNRFGKETKKSINIKVE